MDGSRLCGLGGCGGGGFGLLGGRRGSRGGMRRLLLLDGGMCSECSEEVREEGALGGHA